MWQKMLQVGNSGGSETGSSIVTVFSSLDTTPSDTIGKKAQTITKYNESLFNEYFEYDSTNKQYTVKKDCNAIIQFMTYMYSTANQTNSIAALFINGTEKKRVQAPSRLKGSYKASESIVIELKVGDYFCWYNPTSDGYPCSSGIVSIYYGAEEVTYYSNKYGTFNEVIIFS